MMLFNILSHATRKSLALFLSISLVTSSVSWAATEPVVGQTPPAPVDISLETLLKNALERNGMIKESLGDVEVARSQVQQANAALYPKAQALLLGAPIFEERGNALSSRSNWNNWGPYLAGGLQVIQPLYTFGMISSYQNAANKQVAAKSELADVKRNEVVMTTKEFYYGYLMANDLEALVQDLIDYLDEATTTAEKNLEKPKSTVKEHDVFKLKTALEDLRQKKLLATQSRQTAERAVSWMSATEFERLKKKALEPEKVEMRTLEEYLKTAKAKRPEFRALAAGQEARAALRDAKRAQSYPIVFVGGFAQAGWSPVRDKQPTVFSNDPFNQITGGAGLGIKFDLEFARHAAEAAEQEAELMKLKATESYAVPGIELQVKKAFWELEQAKEGLEVAKRRKDLAKKWFVSSAMGWSVGLTAAKDLMEALEGDGTAKKNYVETIYQFNMALARLSQAIGEEVTSLKYR